MADDQARMNARLLENFNAGLERLGHETDLDAVLHEHVTMERFRAENPELVREYGPNELPAVEAAACRAVMAFHAETWLSRSAYYPCESPLERALDLALRVVGETNLLAEVIIGYCNKGRHRERAAYAPDQISICHQHHIGAYRVDFLVAGHDYDHDVREIVRLGQVVVEVDGHDFHERTKDQARRDKARDREIQRAGYQVFRFTGSEVWSDPIGCAKEVVDAALRRKPEPAESGSDG